MAIHQQIKSWPDEGLRAPGAELGEEFGLEATAGTWYAAPDVFLRYQHWRVEQAGQGFEEDQSSGPVLLLHGLGATMLTWRKILPGLGGISDVYALDLLGFGQSAKPKGHRYDVFAQAELVLKFIEEAGLKNVTVVGNSMGGGVALAMAIQQLDMPKSPLAGLILIDSVAYPQPMPFYLALVKKRFLGEFLLSVLPAKFIIRQVLDFGFHDGTKIEDLAVRAYAEGLRTTDGKVALAAAIRQLEPENIEEITSQYCRIQLPTLIVWGERDQVIAVKMAERLHQDMPNSKLHRVALCGHLPQEECPDQVIVTINEFLQSLRLW